ncbi:hypothetical protein [Streptomyces purpureus]|uniref:Uncharacterized protein n=1 Tax=Streptomyces purpureus TaxID=1951 RepID=A0A918LSF1_9ACTN|nr:hypothetical protein [Streptomyces purpureus]GGT43331.1 hypothetical protein GCM10014713_41240 [Streptomyces purpureus]
MAFPQTPLDVRTELQIGGVWTDISSDVYTRSPIAIEHGRSDESVRTTPSKCSLVLNNRDGVYSSRNPLSPYFGLIGRNTPIRVSVQGSESYLSLPGTQADIASTPDHASLDITGDIDVRVEATLIDWYGSARQTLIGKWNSADSQRSWFLRVGNGLMTFSWTTGGSNATAHFVEAVLPPMLDRAALRATLDVDNGAGGHAVSLYWAESLDGPWTLLITVTGSGATSIYNSTSPLTLAPTDLVSSPNRLPLLGRIHRAEVRSGIDGTAAANPDFRALTEGTTAFSDAAGRSWTLAGAAKITDREYRFHGEVSSWPPRWDVSGEDVWVPIEAAGIQRRLGAGRKPLSSTLRRRIPSGGPIAYWPMEEGERATQAYSTIPTVVPLRTSGMDWAADDSLPGSSALPKLTASASILGYVPRSTAAGWHAECVYFLPTMPAAQTQILRITVAGSVMRYATVYASTGGIRIEAKDAEDNVLAFFNFTTSAALTDFASTWNRLQLFTADQGGGVTRLTAAWRDVSAGGGYWYAATTFTGAQGAAVNVSGSWGAATQDMTIGHLAVFDEPGVFDGALYVPSVTIYDGADDGFAGETALSRLARLTDEESATVTLSWLDGDLTQSSEAMGPQRPAALLDLLQECADTDGGILYESLDRLAHIYRDRTSLYNQAPALELDYAADGEVGPPLEPVEDDQRLRNDVTVNRDGGSSGRAVDEEGPLSVLPPPDGVGVYEEAVTLSLAADSQAQQIAGWRLRLGTVDELRYPSVRLMLHAAPHLIPDVLRMRIGDKITISNPPPWLPPDPIELIMQGYTEILDQFEWDIVANCSPGRAWTVGVLPADTAGWGEPDGPGRLDTDGSELAAGVTSAATTMSVAFTEGPRWITAAPNVVPGPCFRTGTGTWECTRGASIGAVTLETEIVPPGLRLNAARLTRVHVSDTGTLNMTDQVLHAAAAGQQWKGSAWVYNPGDNGSPNMRVGIAARDGGGTDTITFGSAPAAPVGWSRLTVGPVTLPAGTVSARLTVEGRSGWTLGEWWVMAYPRLARVDGVDDTHEGDMPLDITVGGERMTVHGITSTTSPQAFTVERSVNGIVKGHSAGADVRLADPTYLAL